MDLKNLKVQELNAQELEVIDGGIWREILLYAAEYYLENPYKFSNPNHTKYKLGHVGGGRP